MARTPLIAGNWKMYKTEAQAEQYIQALLPLLAAVSGVDVGICVPFTDLRAMVDSARGSRVEVYAQNVHHEPEGAFTGEVSPPMLAEIGARGVVLGHSERRALFGETDRALALKLPAALHAGLHPILCVGETEEERPRGTPSASCASRSVRTSPAWRTSGSPTSRSPTSRSGRSAPARPPPPSRPRTRSPSSARSSPIVPAPRWATACGSSTGAR